MSVFALKIMKMTKFSRYSAISVHLACGSTGLWVFSEDNRCFCSKKKKHRKVLQQ